MEPLTAQHLLPPFCFTPAPQTLLTHPTFCPSTLVKMQGPPGIPAPNSKQLASQWISLSGHLPPLPLKAPPQLCPLAHQTSAQEKLKGD
ncbi:hypothetical protein H8959_001317 [Pygathrix nigripes]